MNDARLQTLLSKMLKKGPKMTQHVKIFDPASLPPWQAVMNQQLKRVIFMAHIWKCAHLDITWWEPVGHRRKFVPLWLTVIKCHRNCSVKKMDLLVTTITLMMNAWHLLRTKVYKIEGPRTHAVNAQINMI